MLDYNFFFTTESEAGNRFCKNLLIFQQNQTIQSESFTSGLCFVALKIADCKQQKKYSMSTLTPHQHTDIWVEWGMVRQRTQACCYERLLEDLDCLKCKVLGEADTLRLTQGEEEKHGVLAHEEAEGRKVKNKESLLIFCNVELGRNGEHDSIFCINLINLVWNSVHIWKHEIQEELFSCC